MNKYIFSVFQNNESERYNVMNHIETVDQLKSQGLNPIEATGKYKGITELSIILDGQNNEDIVVNHCKLNNQESYLRIYPDSSAELVFLKNLETVQLGYFTEVSQNEANETDASTEINGKFFVCKAKVL